MPRRLQAAALEESTITPDSVEFDRAAHWLFNVIALKQDDGYEWGIRIDELESHPFEMVDTVPAEPGKG